MAPYVSNPARGGGLHNYGLAVDITIVDASGHELPMGTKIDHLGPEANIHREKQLVAQGKITEAARQNRILLRRVMKAGGFMPPDPSGGTSTSAPAPMPATDTAGSDF